MNLRASELKLNERVIMYSEKKERKSFEISNKVYIFALS